jgi:hypothetical protein
MADVKDLKSTYLKISRRLEAILRAQAKGSLKNSVSVTYDEKGMTISESSGYGIYTHQGTGKYRKGNTYADTMNLPYDPNPGVGEGGIQPRYWLNLSQSVWQQIDDEIAKAVGLILEAQIVNAFQK